MKSKFIIVLLLVLSFRANATNYYWSYVSGDDNTGNGTMASPWKTTVKFQSMLTTFVDGDSALWKRGEVIPMTAGVYAHDYQVANFVVGAYGTGANPVFTGLQSLTGWTSIGTNLWKTTVPNIGSSKIQLVRINGTTVPMGRYPNTSSGNGGYLQYENSQSPFTGNVYDAELPNSPSRIGQEVVVRKTRWIIDKATVTGHNNGLITFVDPSGYTASGNFGYFFQNHPSLLDEDNEWYYNPSTKEMTLFSTANPSTKNVQAAIVDTLFYFWGKFYMQLNGLTMEGSNVCNLLMELSAGVKAQNLTIRHAGLNGFLGITMPDLLFQNDSIYNVGNNGFYCGGDSVNFKSNLVRDCGLYPGMGASNNQARMGALVSGPGGKIWDNKVRNIGYNGIYFVGSYVSVLRNDVDTFCVTADDGGGIYASGGGSDTLRRVQYNVVRHGFGQKYGTNQNVSNSTMGIYMDDRSANVDISFNVITDMSENGIYLHNSKDIKADSNIIYNCEIGYTFNHDPLENNDWRIRRITFTRNVIHAKESNQIFGRIFSTDNDLSSFGSFNKNYYYGRNPVFHMSTNYGQTSTDVIDISAFRGTYGYDQNSGVSTITAPSDSISIVVNTGATVLVTPLSKAISTIKGLSKTVTVAVAARSAEIFTITGDIPTFNTQTIVVPIASLRLN